MCIRDRFNILHIVYFILHIIYYTSNSRRGGRSGVVIYRIGGVSLPPRQQQQRAKATATTTRAMMMKMMMMQRPNNSAIWDPWAALAAVASSGSARRKLGPRLGPHAMQASRPATSSCRHGGLLGRRGLCIEANSLLFNFL